MTWTNIQYSSHAWKSDPQLIENLCAYKFGTSSEPANLQSGYTFLRHLVASMRLEAHPRSQHVVEFAPTLCFQFCRARGSSLAFVRE
jgi:hypothetical protein